MECNHNVTHSYASSAFVFLLALIIGAQPIATDLYLPAMPDLAKDVPAAALGGLVFSSASTLTFFTLFYGLGQVMGGQWADRYGRRRSLLVALAVYTVCGLVGALVTNMVAVLAVRAVQGAATATIVVTARAAIRDSYSVAEAPHTMTAVFMRLGIVVVLCPIVGAFLAMHGGWRATLWAMAAYGAALWVWCAWRFVETRPQSHHPDATSMTTWRLLRTLWASPSFRIWTLITSVTISGIFTFLTVSSHLFIGLMHFSPYAYGAVLVGGAVTFVCSNVLCARLLKTYHSPLIARLGAGLSLAGGVIQVLGASVLAPSSGVLFPVVLIVGQYTYALGHGMLQSCAMAGSTADFPHMAGRASAWSGLTMMVTAFFVSQIAASFVNPAHTYGVWPWSLTLLVCGMVLVMLTRQLKEVTSR